MIFRGNLADLAMAGIKTQTRRRLSDNPKSPWWRDRCAYNVGQAYAIQTGRGLPGIGFLIVEAVDKVRLGHITHPDAVAEGCADVRDFMHVWRTIHGDWTPDEYVWRLTFHAEHHGL